MLYSKPTWVVNNLPEPIAVGSRGLYEAIFDIHESRRDAISWEHSCHALIGRIHRHCVQLEIAVLLIGHPRIPAVSKHLAWYMSFQYWRH
jgi:hypothetical protein